MKSIWKMVGRIVLILLALLFAQAGIQKVVGTEAMVDMFDAFGYSGWLRVMVGGAEVLGAAGLMIKALSPYAAVLLSVIMTGAIVTEFLNQQAEQALMPASLLCILIVFAYFQTVRRRRHIKQVNDGEEI